MEDNITRLYKPELRDMTPCGNGDFETELDPMEWQGAYGVLNPQGIFAGTASPGNINFSSLTEGILSGLIADGNAPINMWDQSVQAHHTWVGLGVDPNVGIPTTAPSSSGAVRIGNMVAGAGCELLSKTFIVTAINSRISFWYAAVFENPDPAGHPGMTQPYFMVRITDGSGSPVSSAFDFGAGNANILVPSGDPFFQTKDRSAEKLEPIRYKDWTCAQIDLTSQIGQQVTVEFVVADCWHTGHWGYAYIDRFCGNCKGSPAGSMTYSCESSSHCGKGKICVDYDLPKAMDAAGNQITGTADIVLSIYQNGSVIVQMASSTLSTGTTYCFDIGDRVLPNLNDSLGGFDFTLDGTFTIGTNTMVFHEGTAPDGMALGQNNDYMIACKTCAEYEQEQNDYLSQSYDGKVNLLSSYNCDCPDGQGKGGCGCGSSSGASANGGTGIGTTNGKLAKNDCECDCTELDLPRIEPCISIAWGDSECDCIETDDIEVLMIRVCNCYSNITFENFSIAHIAITDMAGHPVPSLPDGTPSVQVIPSGPICFDNIGPCLDKDHPSCVSRELVLYTRGAKGGNYKLAFEGVCFSISYHDQTKVCFTVSLCKD